MDNVLFAKFYTAFAATFANIKVYNATFDGILFYPPSQPQPSFLVQGNSQTVVARLTNCVLASVTILSTGAPVGGDYNGFFNNGWTPGAAFGSHQVPTATSPFVSAAGGAYYLASGYGFQDAGTANIDPDLLRSLGTKTTQPPDMSYVNQTLTADTILSPLIIRDNGPTDLGYHYDLLDYICSGVAGGARTLTLSGGVAVGVFGSSGFAVGTFISQGAACQYNQLTVYSSVQEAPWGARQSRNNVLSGSSAQLQLTEVSLASGGASQYLWGNMGDVSVANCDLLAAHVDVACPSWGGVTFTDDLLNRCTLSFAACCGAYPVTLRNNLFLQGTLSFAYCSYDFYPGVTITDNLFVQNSFSYTPINGHGPWNISYNGYYGTTQIHGYGVSGGDKTVATLDFQPGPRGPYYYPTSGGNLSQLIDGGSRSALDAGLSSFTTVPAQTLDSGTVDIGYHYPFTSAPYVFDSAASVNCGGPLSVSAGDNCGLELMSLSYIIVTPPQHGILSYGTQPGEFIYTPVPPAYCGLDSFVFKVNNGYLDSSVATETVTVGDPSPVANCQDVMMGVGGPPVTIQLSGLDNCGSPLTFVAPVAGTGPSHGSLGPVTPVDASHATVIYTPTGPPPAEPDHFDFTVNNCLATSQPAQVTVNVVSGPVLYTQCRPDRILLSWVVPRWLADQDPNGFFHDFRIYRCPTSSGSCNPTVLYTTITDPNARTYEDTAPNVTQGVTYCYAVTFRRQDACDPSVFYESPLSNVSCNQLCPTPAPLITGNNAVGGGNLIQTYSLNDGAMVGSFRPDGASLPHANGRALAVHGGEIFYTELDYDTWVSDGIHVAPYGNQGSGGPDTRLPLPNPRPGIGIQGLAFSGNVLYALTGYPYDSLQVFELDPASGAPIPGSPIITIADQHTLPGLEGSSDGFVVLPGGNFLVNDYDGGNGATIYREYYGTNGNEVPGGLQIDLAKFGFAQGRGVALAPDGQSLYFVASLQPPLGPADTFVQTDLTGGLLGFQSIIAGDLEDIDVVAQ